ncbi:DNA-binding protein [Nocardia sp. 852002-20019_SCH5090214]|jgi:DNA-binding protein HU-beta|uniref:DNA-binding protein HupB n=1 Tax=Nocardia nova TaxID=37330 RepID=A0A2S6A971_9NOCA|nr:MULTISPECIES: HU family DNA-binding protein [Nocardia]OBF85899.1 DNA-binding protein [Mycobacterium sp. 852002-51759_SCH5129042]MBF6274208.1 HU family DNA-binding protein [Nocardia nova]OBA40090.1 DNA-binding protein [Nocardia sp. 852002-51101_SCH5132738]OBA48095.1 DNA-binding protein [Nocardia sp. 852002-20019_SCH5090214]OBB44984.1 DNA-binding protein [Nocardia sp. 852002-51244_SCH5132740]
MNKAELIDVLTEKLGTDRRTATAAVEHIVDTIVRAVNKGQSVTITGFGVFEQRKRAARVARNPRTGETVKVKPTSVPAFRPGAQFKAIISGKQKIAAAGPAVKRGVAAPVSGAAKKAAKKTTAKKTAAKKTTAKKAAPAKKTTAKKTAAKAPAKKVTTAKKTAPAKKAPAKKTTATKATAKKTAAKKTTAAKTAAKKAPAKKTAAKRTATKRTTRR